ncbi:MAG: YicC/YloC family endoribonuclease [Treponemataceae bacterium]|nr:YicC/YloC family endoribonuclease [Treponemataceae bacterium]
MNSMTGYAYNEVVTENYTVSVEFKSVNSRFLDLSINLPSFLGRIENKFKEIITSKIQRGKLDIFIRVKETNVPVSISVDENMAKSYFEAISKIAKSIGQNEKEIPLSLIVTQEGVLSSQKEIDIEKYYQMILPVFEKSLEEFIIDRNREGENLKKDLLYQLEKIQKASVVFTEWQPKMENAFKENIIKKFNEILGDKVDEQRVMTEVASLMVKYTINEEIVRLKSHIKAIQNEIENNATPGKRLDFICQEMNREINTIGSKNQFIEIAEQVINAKDALENIREQSKNIE